MEWTEEAIAQLRVLWLEGHSTAEIGRRMGITKNAVVGKAHRLVLSSRPSPIRREGAAAAPRRPARVPTPPVGDRRLADTQPTAPRPQAAPSAPVPAEPRPSLRAVPAVSPGRVTPCCWPIGEPGTRSFRFCDDATLPNKPYCATHAQLAYVKVRDRRDTAA